MNTNSPTVEKWENDEIKRSASEAEKRALDDLTLSEWTRKRYESPAENTPYPLEYAYHLLGDTKGKVVLDYGCGAGENTVLVAAHGAKVIGVDISPDLLELAAKRMELYGYSCYEFNVGSAHDLPMEDESIDIVFGIGILHHLELQLASKQVYRVLKRGGRAIFLEPVRNSKLVRFIRGLIPYQAPDVSRCERPLTDVELDAFSKDFSPARSRVFSLPFVNLIETLGFTSAPLHAAIKIDRVVLKSIPFLKKFASVKVFEIVK
jgi:SAM-dependent methyltransferase